MTRSHAEKASWWIAHVPVMFPNDGVIDNVSGAVTDDLFQLLKYELMQPPVIVVKKEDPVTYGGVNAGVTGESVTADIDLNYFGVV